MNHAHLSFRRKPECSDFRPSASDTPQAAGSRPSPGRRLIRIHLAVQGVADAAITAKVKAKLAAERDVGAMNIKVDPDGGMETLSGNARSQAEADKAAELAKTTSGVTSVTNDIRVNATGTTGAKY